jgi:hypothetical protein
MLDHVISLSLVSHCRLIHYPYIYHAYPTMLVQVCRDKSLKSKLYTPHERG